MKTPEAYRVKQSLNHLLALEKTPLSRQLERVQNAFEQIDSFFITISQDKQNELHLNCVPRNLPELIKTHLWDKYPHTILVTPYAKSTPQNHTYDFLLNKLALPPSTQIKDLTSSLAKFPLYIVEDTLPPTKPGHFKQTIELLDHLTANLDHVFLIHTAKLGIESIHKELANKLKHAGINLLSQGVSGGLGKIAHITHHNQEKTVLLGKLNMLEELIQHKEFPLQKRKHFVIINLPFEPPDLQELENNENSFESYTLPAACLKLQQTLHLCLHSNLDVESLTILDSRLLNTNYGQEIQNVLKQNYDLISLTQTRLLAELRISNKITI